MTEHGTKLLPVTVSVSCPDPATALVGAIDVATGRGKDDGAVTEMGSAFETAKPFDTVIEAVACATVSVYGMRAVSCVGLTKDVGRGEPFQFITEPPLTKFVPFTCNVTLAGLQLGVEVAVDPETVTELMVGVGG
jgi:hypothetical protein